MLGKCYIALGIISIIYFVIYMFGMGYHTSFAFFFLGLGVFLIAMGTVHLLSSKELINVPRWFHGIYHVCAALAICVFAIVETFIIRASTTPPVANADYVVVPGYKVVGKDPSTDLKQRLDAAYQYFNDNPNTVIVLSGAKGPGEKISEAQAMQDYLFDKGVPSEQIIIEEEATKTSENAKKITDVIMNDSNIHSHNSKKMKDVKVVVATNA